VRLVLLGALAAACFAPDPTMTPVASVAPATLTPRPTIGVSHFDEGGLSFDHPSEWHVIAQDEFNGVDFVMAVVGTGDWNSGCETIGNVTTCGAPALITAPGEVVAQFSTFGHGPATALYEIPSFDSVRTSKGLTAVTSDTYARLFAPGGHPVEVHVRYGGPPSATLLAQVAAMINSVDYGRDHPATQLTTWDDSAVDPEDCPRQELAGQLGRGDMGGLNLLESDSSLAWLLSWPSGWTARPGGDRRLELLDEEDHVVAREWDEVLIGGRGSQDDFRVCPGAVTVTREFPH
jgi:hypothetical protein